MKNGLVSTIVQPDQQKPGIKILSLWTTTTYVGCYRQRLFRGYRFFIVTRACSSQTRCTSGL